MLNDEQVRAYLDRIGFAGRPPIEEAALDELIFLHQKSVPFETYDIHVRGLVPDLSEEALFEKVVVRRRGGYCFELNKMFQLLLEALGFKARPVLSRAVRGREARMPINHRGMLVTLDGVERVVDVGFGGPMPAGSLRLVDGEEQHVRGEVFTLRKVDGSWWAIERVTRADRDFFDDAVPERRQVELELCTAVVEEVDFSVLSTAFAQPGTLFRDHLVCNLRTDSGHCALMDRRLTVRDNGRKSVVDFASEEELAAGLRDYFGMAGQA